MIGVFFKSLLEWDLIEYLYAFSVSFPLIILFVCFFVSCYKSVVERKYQKDLRVSTGFECSSCSDRIDLGCVQVAEFQFKRAREALYKKQLGVATLYFEETPAAVCTTCGELYYYDRDSGKFQKKDGQIPNFSSWVSTREACNQTSGVIMDVQPLNEQRCFAKINLSLKINNKRKDGFHNIQSIFASINLYDDLILSWDKRKRVKIKGPYSSVCKAEGGANNLITRAIILYRKADQADGWLKDSDSKLPEIGWQLTKKIPIGAGLAGGSSDAAGALRALQQLTGSACPEDRLEEIALELGSDVPFCLRGGVAWGEGRGEKLRFIKCERPFPFKLIIVKPPFSISTAEAYSTCQPTGEWDRDEIDGFLERVAKGTVDKNDIHFFRNDFETENLPHFSDIVEIKSYILGAGAFHAMLSGSGSTVIGFFEDEESRETGISWLRSKYGKTYFVRPVEILRPGIDLIY